MTGPAGSWSAGKGLSERGAVAGNWQGPFLQGPSWLLGEPDRVAGSGFQDGEVLSAGQDIMLLELVGVELGLSRASRPLCGGDLGCCRPDSALADGLCFNPAPFLTLAPTWEGLEGPSHHPCWPSAVPFPCCLAPAWPA